MRITSFTALIVTSSLFAGSVCAQEENGISTEVELGAVITTGNTEDENFNFRGEVDWRSDAWVYGFLIDGFRSSRQDVLAAHRMYYVASAQYDINEDSFILSRVAHEDDRFSGYDYQTDVSVSYGRNLLTTRPNMALTVEGGVGARRSRLENDEFDEAIVRFAGDYEWSISESAVFGQSLSTEVGDETSIYRSESSIETAILDNLSLRFSINIKYQTDVECL